MVRCPGDLLFGLKAECIGVVVHPPEQCCSRAVRTGARRLAGLDPPADEILGELPETAARVVQFFGFLAAAREEGLVESCGTCRIGLQKNIDPGRHSFEVAHERKTCAVANE